MKMRKIMFCTIVALLLLPLLAGSGMAAKKKGLPENKKAANVSMMQQMDDSLMKQLQPMPRMNTGDRIGVLVITLANPYWVGMKEAYEAAAVQMGVKAEVMAAPTEGDTKSQLETLDAMVAKDYKALIVSPIEPFNLIPGVVKANKKGVKVVNLGPPINAEAVSKAGGWIDGRITVAFEEQGAMAARHIIALMGKKGGKVAIIQGISGAGQSEGRTRGARGVFEKTPGVKVVSIQPANWDRNTAYNVTKNLIQAHPDLRAIFCCNDVMALAAVSALESAGKRKGRIVFGVDFIPEAREAIQTGKLDGSIAYSSRAYGRAAIILALKSIQGHKLPTAIYSPLVSVTRANVARFADWK
jgi:ABC-type sugar transport system substrate-binding protein